MTITELVRINLAMVAFAALGASTAAVYFFTHPEEVITGEQRVGRLRVFADLKWIAISMLLMASGALIAQLQHIRRPLTVPTFLFFAGLVIGAISMRRILTDMGKDSAKERHQ